MTRVDHSRMANAIRALAMDAVEKAKSGHPGLPMGAADIATVLFTQFLKFDAADPKWPDRDRFVLSNGHASMLLYSLLHLAQVKAVTKTTEEIKAEISTVVWNKQKRWEMKRDVLFEATKRIAEVDDAMLSYATVVKEDHAKQKVWATVPPTMEEQLNWAEAKHERQNRWSTVSTAFDESRLFAGIVCGKEGKGAFEELGAFINRLAAQMTKDPNAYESSRADLINKILLTRNAIRKELEVDG